METNQNQEITNLPNQTQKPKFTSTIGFKILIIVPMLLLLLIPTALVENLVSERQYYSKETIQKIAGSWGKEQNFRLPIITIPYSQKTYGGEWDKDENTVYSYPENTTVSAEIVPEVRKYGIYECVTYRTVMKITGNIQVDRTNTNTKKYNKDKAELSFSQCTSFSGTFNGTELTSTNISSLINLNGNNTYEIEVELKGISSFSIEPFGKSTSITISGNWADVGFDGVLPDTKSIDKNFTATWENVNGDYENTVTVNLINGVDHYQQTMRSVKFSMLFILLTFACMLLIEVLTNKNISIFQYVLVAIALILYYLLLLSFSEVIGFGLAYLSASVATILLLVAFFVSIVKDIKSSSVFAGTLIILYSFWYILLQMENYALLAGSILCFIILAVAMYFSVKISKKKI
jgi:inner membrane protein